MKRLVLTCAFLSFMAISCELPERATSIIPPTNTKELCKSDARFFYSATFDFCIPYANDAWVRINESLPYDVIGTTITAYDFFTRDIDGKRYQLFTLFVDRATERNETIFEERHISVGYHESPYLIGYIITHHDEAPDFVRDRQGEIPEMLMRTEIFAKLEEAPGF